LPCENHHEAEIYCKQKNWEEITMNIEHVPGKNVGTIMLYALSTCGWCKKTKELLNNIGIEYNYIFVDLVQDKERETVIRELEKWNPNRSFPTLVINNDKCIIGFQEDEIRKAVT
jgi:glutaredoxin-like protein NrdH